MTPSRIVKQYDTYPPLPFQFIDSTHPSGVDTTSATGAELVAKGVQTMTIIRGAAVQDVGSTGNWHYAWAANDLAVPDTYAFESQLTWGSGPPTQLQTFPGASASNPTFECDATLDGSMGLEAHCVDCGDPVHFRNGHGTLTDIGDGAMIPGPDWIPGAWVCRTHGDACFVVATVDLEARARARAR